MKRSILTISAGICVTAAISSPNIIVITVDDMSWHSLGVTGCSIPGLTPNTDSLASRGMLIEHCFVSTPVSGPSRNTIFTGMYPQTNGHMGHGHSEEMRWWHDSHPGFVAKPLTAYLRPMGYFTGLMAKHAASRDRFDYKRNGAEMGVGRDPRLYHEYVLEFLAEAGERPFMLSVNIQDPHEFWALEESETVKWANSTTAKAKHLYDYPNGKHYPDPQRTFSDDDVPRLPQYPYERGVNEYLKHYYNSVARMDETVRTSP